MTALILIAAAIAGSYWLFGLGRKVEWYDSAPLGDHKPNEWAVSLADTCGRADSLEVYLNNIWTIRDHGQGVSEGLKPRGEWPFRRCDEPAPALAAACQKTVEAVAEALEGPKAANVTRLRSKERSK